MNLILLQSNEVDAAGRVELADARACHIRKVLRAKPGKTLRVGLLNGPLGEGRVTAVECDRVVLECRFESAPPPRPKVDLILAMPRPKVMKRLWAQLAALGVGRIILIRAAKVERYYFDSHVIEPEFYTNLLVEGLQQARCTHLPAVTVRSRFRPFVEDELAHLTAGALRLIADPSGASSVSELSSLGSFDGRVVLAIGPEGGWDPFELQLLRERGFEAFHMGNRILRTDTACVALLAAIHQRI